MRLAAALTMVLLGVSIGGCGRSDLFTARGHAGGGLGGNDSPGSDGGSGGRDGGPPDGPPPCSAKLEICNNGVDDNCNNRIDCQDPGCFGDRTCIKAGVEICNNGLDDDFDGLVDCADPDCAGSPSCRPVMGTEICDNGRDDNGDGLVDCSDPQCTKFPSCLATRCQVDVQFGTIAPQNATVTKTMNTSGAPNTYATCAQTGGHGRVGEFTLTQLADVRLDFTQVTGTAHVVALLRAGANQACDQNQIDCQQIGQTPTATHTYPGLAAGVYRIIVESYPGAEGSTQVTLSTGNTRHGVEICNNGIDDDMNGLVDCADSACISSPLCVGSECTPDANVGALVLGAPAKMITVNTAASTSRYQVTCAGASAGADRAVLFTVPVASTVDVVFNQGGDHVFGLFAMPPAGLACDDKEKDCFNPGLPAGEFAITALPAGQYLLIVKATSPQQTGLVSLRLSISPNGRGDVEICGNGIDDDGDGLTDCMDPDCFGVGNCTASVCTPDTNAGSFTPGPNPASAGTIQTLTIDTTTGKNLYQTDCSHGDGKEKVVRLNLTAPMSLGINCTETGSHVFQLSRQLQPLDACNANSLNCADPEVLPFGCSFAIPNLQPGTYNLIVQAFQPGSEGSVTLTLSAFGDAIREICNNGVDDDGDGLIDCMDLKCVTDASCAKFACRADQTVGLLPLDGTGSSVVVQTSTAGDDLATAMCTSAPGGQDAVVNFQLPALSDLTLQWAQVGNHALAIYADAGMLLACEASSNWACFKTGGAATGMQVFPRLPMGRYHLVVDADKPGSEGGVVLKLSALPSP
jgi:hypothetical protein